MKELIILSILTFFHIASFAQNNKPIINGNNVLVCAGDVAYIDITTSDADGDNILLSWNKGVPNASFHTNNGQNATARIRFNTSGVKNVIDSTTYKFIVTAGDGIDKTTKEFKFIIKPKPLAFPIIKRISGVYFDVRLDEHKSIPWNNYDSLTFECIVKDTSGKFIHSSTISPFTFKAPENTVLVFTTTYRTPTCEYTSTELYGSLKELPIIPTISGSNAVVCHGEQACINITANNVAGDSITLTWNSGVKTATFQTISGPNATAKVCLNTDSIKNTDSTYRFSIIADDGNSKTDKEFTFTINTTPYGKPLIKRTNGIIFNVDMKGNNSYAWSKYNNLTFECEVNDTVQKPIYNDTNNTFKFIAPINTVLVFSSTYKTHVCEFTVNDTLSSTISTSINELNTSLKIFPNPTTGKIFIADLTEQVEGITIFDVLGKEVKQLNIISNSFSIANLPAGIYWVQAKTSKEVLRKQKIIKIN